MRYQEHCQHQRARQSEAAREYGADAPGDPDARDLAAFGPEEVEEEGGAEDNCDIDPGEDVIRECTDDFVVYDRGRTVGAVAGLQAALLVGVLYSTPEKRIPLVSLDP